jgi:hypothetical protein
MVTPLVNELEEEAERLRTEVAILLGDAGGRTIAVTVR